MRSKDDLIGTDRLNLDNVCKGSWPCKNFIPGKPERRSDRSASGRDRGHQRLCPNDVHNPGQIVGQDLEGHLGGYFGKRLGQEVRRTHARFHGTERMLDGLAT